MLFYVLMFYVLCSLFFYGPIVSDTNKCMYVCMLGHNQFIVTDVHWLFIVRTETQFSSHLGERWQCTMWHILFMPSNPLYLSLSFPSVWHWLYYWLHHWLFLYRALEAACVACTRLLKFVIITLHCIALHHVEFLNAATFLTVARITEFYIGRSRKCEAHEGIDRSYLRTEVYHSS